MMFKPMPKGIALIQVILITGILSVLVLYISQTARQQIALADMANMRAQALANLQNAKNEILFKLLTEQTTDEYRNESQNSVTSQWNFYGEPFEIYDGVSAILQDQAGLLSTHFINRELMSNFLINNNLSQSESAEIINQLLEQQTISSVSDLYDTEHLDEHTRKGPITDISELQFVAGITPELYNLLKQTMTTSYVGYFNPLNAPSLVLRSLFNETEFRQINSMRQNGELNQEKFSIATSMSSNDSISFETSRFISLKLISTVGKVKIQKSWVFTAFPHNESPSPINFIEVHG
jgi:general secretion pathway protein K